GYSRALGGWAYSYGPEVPVGWLSGGPEAALEIAPVMWANSVQPYLRSEGVYACPSSPEWLSPPVAQYQKPLKPWTDVSYTYNGLLMAYPQAGIRAPSSLPLLWEGFGKVSIAGFAGSSPTLICKDPNAECRYVPRSPSGCAPGNGGKSVTWSTLGTMWI